MKYQIDWKWFLGIMLTVVFGTIPFLLKNMLIPNKNLLVQEEFTSRVLAFSSDSLRDKLEIKFQSKTIDELYISEVLIQNNGSEPVTSRDFEKSLDFVFDSTTQIYDFYIVSKSPNNLTLEGNIIEKNKLIINPFLTNPKDNIRIQILMSNDSKKPSVDARIAGVNEVKYRVLEKEVIFLDYSLWFGGLLLTTITMSLFTIVFYLDQIRYSFNANTLTIIALICWWLGLALMENVKRYYEIEFPFALQILLYGLYYLVVFFATKNYYYRKAKDSANRH